MSKLDKYWDDIHLRYDSTYDGWLDQYIHLLNKNSRIIELGCGKAYSSNFLFDHGFKNIVACDFSDEVLKMVRMENPEMRTMRFNMSIGLPFKDRSADVIIADLCLHYFDAKTTKYIFSEIHRVLKDGSYLIARVNSINDKFHMPQKAQELERNFLYDGTVYKRFFCADDFESLLENFEVLSLEEKRMDRYEKQKMLWEFCIRKSI